MQIVFKYTLLTVLFTGFFFSCKKDTTDTPENPSPNKNTVDVKVVLPESSTADLSNAVLFSLGSSSSLTNQTGKLPYNNGDVEIAYLLDKNNNVLLAGFLSDNQKEISVETTTKVMLYYALDYYLLPNDAKGIFLANVKQIPDFSGLATAISKLFVDDPLMYSKGTYLQKITEKVDELSKQTASTQGQSKRLLINGNVTKSGVTVAHVDSVHVELQNSFPRRTKVFVYKKEFYDRSINLHEIANYRNNPVASFDFEPGKKMDIKTLDVGSKLAQISAQSASVENVSTSEPIELSFNKSSEFAVEYEVAVIGPGSLQANERNMTDTEKAAYEELNLKSYALDFFLPTLLDIGGNKGLLPPFGSDMEDALLTAVRPTLEANPDVLAAIKSYDFKAASETLLPELYGDIRLTDGLRTLLTKVYKIISNDGAMPNTFVQSQELIETGYERTKKVMEAMYKNMNFSAKVSIQMLPTEAKSLESWLIDAIDADVHLSPQDADVCLGDALPIKLSYVTFTDPETEDVEYHWSTSNKFGGKIQDINGDPNSYGASIITTNNEVSYISTALASELGDGDNIETVTVTIYTKNKNTGELSKVGQDVMRVNNKKMCTSFFVPFEKEVKIAEVKETLLCSSGTMYGLGLSYFVADFKAVDGAKSYVGKVLRKDGTYGNEFTLTNLVDLGDNMLEYKLAVGGIRILQTCDEEEALAEQQKRLQNLDDVGHQGIEITPQF